MIIKKIYNARKDLTETRNNTRALKKALGNIRDMITGIQDKGISRKQLKDIVTAEFMRRDIWERAEAETRRLAKGRPVWAIKCRCGESRLRSKIPFRGDYAYCMTLKKYLEREGIYAVVQMYENWYCDIGADAEILMGCLHDYHPDRRVPGRLSAMWLAGHPEAVTDEAADRYDLLLVDSLPLAESLKGRTTARVEPFTVPADTDIFYRDDSPEIYNRVFVGQARKNKRDCVRWCSENRIELDVWGGGWEKYYSDDPYIHLHGPVSYDETAEIYRKARIIINDHQDDMLRTGMINSRCPEVLLCGKTMLCGWSQGIEDEFGDLFTYYHDETDFPEALARAEENYERLCDEAETRYEEIVDKYSLDKVIKRLIRIIDDSHPVRSERQGEQ